ncbi:MAG: hypothetical protein SCI25_05115 [Desulfuromonadales bacterium]|nr:hypothetical protein [Desulfuromonadales bacterium]MDW7757484.1 hypothetical protein [Desulfuromonadales bacterium]
MNNTSNQQWTQRPTKSSKNWIFVVILVLASTLSGCAASRSDLTGAFTQPPERNLGAEKVSVFFLFRHLSQQHGLDALPKVKPQGVPDFENIFRGALGEITNISEYATHTEFPTDVNAPERRREQEELRQTHDYTIDIRFFEEASFKQQFLSGTISLVSLTLIPAPYTWEYTITADVYNVKGALVKSYQRQASLSNWVEALLIFVYPFHPIEGKREEIYVEALHDIFRQIETEKVLGK